MADADALKSQRRAVAVLRQALGAELVETHISFVLIGARHAWKIKKALDLGFADFRTLAQRRLYCEEELRLNRRTAPQLYLRVLALRGTPEAPVLGGDSGGAVIDWVLCMRAFDQRGLWDRMAARGALGAAQIDALVAPLCRLHASAAVAAADSRYGTPAHLRAPMRDNLRVLGRLCREPRERGLLRQLQAWEAQAFAALHDAFAQRRADGFVRECHGDLHLGNVTQLDGQPVLFDCLEFSAELRWTDVASDAAFMAMDLRAHGLGALAQRFVNAWVERSGDAGALRVLRYYLVHRALVRAKVAALRARQLGDGGNGGGDAGTDADTDTAADAGADRAAHASRRRYLRLALRCARAAPPVLLITHGLSGSGKTAATQGLLEACGAMRFRADVQRKRLHGLQPLQRGDAALRERLYSSNANRATHARLFEMAELALRSGHQVILDATFLAREPRGQARALAARCGAAFAILHFEARPDTLRQRIRRRNARGDDASDADLAVLEAQLRSAQPFDDAERDALIVVDAEAELADPAAPSRWRPWAGRLRELGVRLRTAHGWQNRSSN